MEISPVTTADNWRLLDAIPFNNWKPLIWHRKPGLGAFLKAWREEGFMEEKFAYWEFVLKGANAHDIHGVQLRENIRKLAVDAGVPGDVRNVKKDHTVLVRCKAPEEQAERLLQTILKIPDALIKLHPTDSFKRKMTSEGGEPPKIPDEFEIIREDELSEMVWALQGAGKIFAGGEKSRERKLTQALKLALIETSACADEHNRGTPNNRNFVVTALENFISTGPVEDTDLVKQVYDLYQLCGQANEYLRLALSGQRTQDKVKELSEQILKLAGKILENLNNQKG